jgi:hypothetical protein
LGTIVLNFCVVSLQCATQSILLSDSLWKNEL